MLHFIYPLISLVLVLLVGGCAPSVAYVESAGPAEISPSDSLGPGDVIEVRVYREKDLSGTFQVSGKGTISYPLLGEVNVDGKTSAEISDEISRRLAGGLIKDPWVTVLVTEMMSKRVYVLGQVTKPGTFRYQDQMTIIQVITLAGGFSRIARPDATVVTRTVGGTETRFVVPVDQISLGKAKNFYLRPGDIVFVPESIL
jgi:polysaccharide export outer membrane protein